MALANKRQSEGVPWSRSRFEFETRRSIKKSRDRQRKERVREARNELRMTMAEDDVLFDDVYELCEIIGK